METYQKDLDFITNREKNMDSFTQKIAEDIKNIFENAEKDIKNVYENGMKDLTNYSFCSIKPP